jgi:hypothetical protein
MEISQIHVNGEVFNCPRDWSVEMAESRIRTRYGLQFGAIEADGIAVFLTSLISNLPGDLAFVGGQPIQAGIILLNHFI